MLPFIVAALLAIGAQSDPVYNPNNGHYYEWVANGVQYHTAHDASFATYFKGVTGELAPLATYEEFKWVVDNIVPASTPFWIGAKETTPTTRDETAREWVYTSGAWVGQRFEVNDFPFEVSGGELTWNCLTAIGDSINVAKCTDDHGYVIEWLCVPGAYKAAVDRCHCLLRELVLFYKSFSYIFLSFSDW